MQQPIFSNVLYNVEIFGVQCPCVYQETIFIHKQRPFMWRPQSNGTLARLFFNYFEMQFRAGLQAEPVTNSPGDDDAAELVDSHVHV